MSKVKIYSHGQALAHIAANPLLWRPTVHIQRDVCGERTKCLFSGIEQKLPKLRDGLIVRGSRSMRVNKGNQGKIVKLHLELIKLLSGCQQLI